jgi:hypothetical protein
MEKYDVTVDMESTVRFYKKGTVELHRLDGPAVECVDGDKVWYVNGKQHRLDGPAVEYADGSNVWYQNGERHRLDGPAIEYASGTKWWYQNGERHRLDGPAVECADGTNEWFIEGKKYTEAQFNEKIASLNTKEMTIGEIEAKLGHKIKVVK